MYAQQYRQPPKDYGGTAMKEPEIIKQPEPEPCPEPPVQIRSAPGLFSFGSDEIIIAVIIFIVMSGGWEKNALVLIALVFILL